MYILNQIDFFFFHRRIGHWLTPVKPLIPLLQSADSSSTNKCNFTMKTVPWAMAWVPSLNIRLVNKVQGNESAISSRQSIDRSVCQSVIPPVSQVLVSKRGISLLFISEQEGHKKKHLTFSTRYKY